MLSKSRSAFCISTLLFALACQSPDQPVPSQSGIAETPYTAEQIQRANPAGSKVVYRLEVDGQPPVLSTTEFTETSPTGATFRTHTLKMDGTPVGESQVMQTTWQQLQMHAAFPADATTRRATTKETAVGTFDCWLYTVNETINGQKSTKRFWFAKDRPGSPVHVEQDRDGNTVFTMTLVEMIRAS